MSFSLSSLCLFIFLAFNIQSSFSASTKNIKDYYDYLAGKSWYGRTYYYTGLKNGRDKDQLDEIFKSLTQSGKIEKSLFDKNYQLLKKGVFSKTIEAVVGEFKTSVSERSNDEGKYLVEQKRIILGEDESFSLYQLKNTFHVKKTSNGDFEVVLDDKAFEQKYLQSNDMFFGINWVNAKDPKCSVLSIYQLTSKNEWKFLMKRNEECKSKSGYEYGKGHLKKIETK